jgi:hypothetical protein
VSLYLVDLVDWIDAAGVDVEGYPGWETRARGSGGYDPGRPFCVMWHHTASTASLEADAAYCAEGDPDAPVCNAVIGRDGRVVVIAAGASNTNGKGYAMTFSRGTVPNDAMNTHAVGLEICNDGVGEAYPAAQLDAAFAVSLAVCANLDLEPDDVGIHHVWAPDRKIDNATAAAVAGSGFHPRSVNSSGSWNLEDLRTELLARAAYTPDPGPTPPDPGPTPEPGPPGPPISEEEKSMMVAIDQNGTAWIGDGMIRRPLVDEEEFNVKVLLAGDDCLRMVNTQGGRVGGWSDVYEVGDNVIKALGVEA